MFPRKLQMILLLPTNKKKECLAGCHLPLGRLGLWKLLGLALWPVLAEGTPGEVFHESCA
jgi:hypothetical protein